MPRKRETPKPKKMEIPIPVYKMPSDRKFNEFLKDPEKFGQVEDHKKFFRSLRFPDWEVDLPVDLEDES